MGIRFRKSVKLMPGVRINFSKSGMSTTIGPRGASVNIGSKGVYANAGIPGTGIYMREKIGGGASGYSSVQNTHPGVDDLNTELSQILNIHIETPEPHDILAYPHLDADVLFDPPKEVKKVSALNIIVVILFSLMLMGIFPPIGTFLGFILLVASPFSYIKLKKEYTEYLSALNDLNEQKNKFIALQESAEKEFDDMICNQRERAEDILAYVLSDIDWPRETLVSYEVDGDLAIFDVDLPEVEDMVDTQYEATPTGRSIKEKSLSDTRIRQDYARHIHGIGFRVIGEAFRALPFLETVVVSGYSQRPDSSTGNLKDDYLYSVRVTRTDWERINFNNLENVDPIEALGNMEIRRNMSKTGIFKAIEPFEVDITNKNI